MYSKFLMCVVLAFLALGCSQQPVQKVKREVTHKVERLSEQQARDRFQELTDQAREHGKKFRQAQERRQWDQVQRHAEARVELLKEALELASASPERIETRIDVTFDLAEAVVETGDRDQAEALYLSLMKLTGRLQDHQRARRALFVLYRSFDEHQKARDVVVEAMRFETDPTMRCIMMRSLADAQIWNGELEEGEKWVRQGLEELEGQSGERVDELREDFHRLLVRVARERGNDAQAREYEKKVLETSNVSSPTKRAR